MAQLTASTTVKLKCWSNGEKVHTMLEKKNMLRDRYDTTMRFPSYGPHPLPTPPSQLLAGPTQLDGWISIITIGLAKVVVVQREYLGAVCGIGNGYY